ncbi:MAG: hypothetical protein JWP56_2362 [Aeromicrobium sp.]|nr:hypothetical protein [Aeromicrobium sp.]
MTPTRRIYARCYSLLRRVHHRLLLGRPITRPIEVARGPRRDLLLDALAQELTASGISFTTAGKVNQLRPRLHFHIRDRAAVVALLTRSLDAGGCSALFQQWPAPLRPTSQLAGTVDRDDLLRFDVWIQEKQGVSSGSETRSVVEIDFWQESVSALKGSDYAQAPRTNDILTDARWKAFEDVIAPRGERPRFLGDTDAAPDLYGRDFPIDVVFTWVDDQDPAWLAAKAAHRWEPGDHEDHQGRADLPERFRNRDELKYSLRSIEMFAPFVRKIFLVTMDQTPSWLDVSHPQIEVVSHRDIYSDHESLPTFNSSSIETQLHHIEGLAEHFIYFNDDMFLGKPCSWEDFFFANGMMKFFPAGHSISADLINSTSEEYLVADRNAVDLFREHFGFVVHKQMSHVPYPVRRSVLYELEERFQAEFDACQREQFRSPNDLRPIAFMAPHFGFATGRAAPGRLRQRYLALWKPVIDEQLANVLASRKHHTFCLNDAGVPPEREAVVDGLVRTFLEAYFPHPSSFELGAS